VEEELDYGPNGGLVYCIDYLAQNLDWLEEAVGDYEDDYLLVDMPGQVELYTHYKHVNAIAQKLQSMGYTVCSVYLVDSRFVVEPTTFISATLMALSCQVNLELPSFTLLSKMDILKRDKWVRGQDLDMYLSPDPAFLMSQVGGDMSERWRGLNDAMCQLVSDFSLVQMHPFSKSEPDLIAENLMRMDIALQYGEDHEPKMRDEDDDREDYKGGIDHDGDDDEAGW
jgi:GPN-loop GTPase